MSGRTEGGATGANQPFRFQVIALRVQADGSQMVPTIARGTDRM